MDFSVVVPVYNEAENVAPLVGEIRAALGDFDYELIYVDDGSSDGTRTELEDLFDGRPASERVVVHTVRSGQSAALISGVRAARAPWIVTLDGDGQNDPADVPRLFRQALEEHARDPGVVCVAGYRKKRHDSWLKLVSSRIANGVRSRFLNDSIPDTGCGLKVFRRDAFLSIPLFDHVHRFLPALLQSAGARVLVAEVGHRPRDKGVSKYGVHNRLWPGLVDLIGVRWLQSRAIRSATAAVRTEGGADDA